MPKQGSNQLVFTLQPRDTNAHDLPDLDGDDKSEAQDPIDFSGDRKITAKVVSTLDQSGTVALECSTLDDPDMSEAYEEASTSISAGDSTQQVEKLFSETNFTYAKVKFTADTSPTAGELKVVIQAGK